MIITSNRHPKGSIRRRHCAHLNSQHTLDLYLNGIQRESFLPAIDLIVETFLIHEMGGRIDYRKYHSKFLKTYCLYVAVSLNADIYRYISSHPA